MVYSTQNQSSQCSSKTPCGNMTKNSVFIIFCLFWIPIILRTLDLQNILTVKLRLLLKSTRNRFKKQQKEYFVWGELLNRKVKKKKLGHCNHCLTYSLDSCLTWFDLERETFYTCGNWDVSRYNLQLALGSKAHILMEENRKAPSCLKKTLKKNFFLNQSTMKNSRNFTRNSLTVNDRVFRLLL